MIAGQFTSGSGVSSPTGETDVAGGHPRMPDLSREGPFDILQDRPESGASPRVLDGVRGCQYRMTSYDKESGGPDFTPAYIPSPYGRTSRVWDFLLVKKSGCAGGRGFTPRSGPDSSAI